MKITKLTQQQKNTNRINVFVDGKYRLSLDISQLTNLGIKIGSEYSESQLLGLENEAEFSKLYFRALEYCLMRTHSAKEVRDYLWRKTRPTRYRSKKTGQILEKPGVSEEIAKRVYDKLEFKNYINDEQFAGFWIENRNQKKGMSRRKIEMELMSKGVDRTIIEEYIGKSLRDDSTELLKIISKKRNKYPDDKKLMQYLVRQGFSYDDVAIALKPDNNN